MENKISGINEELAWAVTLQVCRFPDLLKNLVSCIMLSDTSSVGCFVTLPSHTWKLLGTRPTMQLINSLVLSK